MTSHRRGKKGTQSAQVPLISMSSMQPEDEEEAPVASRAAAERRFEECLEVHREPSLPSPAAVPPCPVAVPPSPVAIAPTASASPVGPEPLEAVEADWDSVGEQELYGSVGEPEAFASVGEGEVFAAGEAEAMMPEFFLEADEELPFTVKPSAEAEASGGSEVTGRLMAAAKAAATLQCTVQSFADSASVAVASHYEKLRREGPLRWVYSAVSGTRSVLCEAVLAANEKAQAAQQCVQAKAARTATEAKEQALAASVRAAELGALARTKASEVRAAAVEVAADRKYQATAVGAAGGAAALGATGGVAGLATGTIIGVAVGFVPALFTFGLSIPIGAAIGASTGLVIGTGVGGAAGALGGGAAGYGAYSKRGEIREGAQNTLNKVGDCAEYVKDKANASVGYVKQKASMVRTRIAGGTGGTENSD